MGWFHIDIYIDVCEYYIQYNDQFELLYSKKPTKYQNSLNENKGRKWRTVYP